MELKKLIIMHGVSIAILLLCISIAMFLLSCTKDSGEGGNASIYGSVWVKNYNSTFTQLLGEYTAFDEDVYIIYGNQNGYSDHTKTNYQGVYSFYYLRPGKYTIYVYSKDSTLLSPSGSVPVVKNVEITKNKQDLKVPEITIFK
jgi:hypothetical protein